MKDLRRALIPNIVLHLEEKKKKPSLALMQENRIKQRFITWSTITQVVQHNHLLEG